MTDDSFEAHQAALDQENAERREALVKQYVERVEHRGQQEITVDDAVELLCVRDPTPLNGPVIPEALRDHGVQAADIRRHIENAVAMGGTKGLKTTNQKAKPGDWRLKLANLVEWANRWEVGNRHIAEEVAARLALSTDTPTTERTHRRAKQFSGKRERVLGAALAVVAHWPDQCQDKRGKFVPQNIADLIEQKSFLFFKDDDSDGEAPMNTRSMAEHIKHWLEKI